MLLRSALLSELPHGFSTRVGGVSGGRYATLNLGGKWGDDPAAVAENRRRVAEATGLLPTELRLARQVHGRAVAVADGRSAEEVLGSDADAVVATETGLAPSVLTADCVPILIADEAGRVAAVHAGWRGAVADIAGATVEELVSRGCAPSRLRAAIGPSICPRCFEVGEDVAAQFAPSFVIREASWPKPHVDLWALCRAQLVAAGLEDAKIETLGRCTVHEPELFFSFRRDGANIGQMMSFIAAGRPAQAARSAARP